MFVAVAPGAFAQVTPPKLTKEAPTGTVEKLTDAKFVEKASQCDANEIALGKVAVAMASSPQVKQFAQKMIDDHTKCCKMLMEAASPKGFTCVTEMDAKHKDLRVKLESMKGADFDREYMKHVVMGHEMAVKMFQQQAQNGQDANLKAFAAKTLPALQQHQTMAQEIMTGLQKGTTKTGSVIQR